MTGRTRSISSAKRIQVHSREKDDNNNGGRNVTLELKHLTFTYPGIDGQPPTGPKPLIQDLSLTLRAGDRCLLVGANGAGKTTILKLMGGKLMVEPDMVRVLGRSAFHDTSLTSSGQLCYLGREVLLLDEITVDLDVLARADLLAFLKNECKDRGATTVYATHIFGGLEEWPSHIACVAHGKLQLALPLEKVNKMKELSLTRTVEKWLRKEKE